MPQHSCKFHYPHRTLAAAAPAVPLTGENIHQQFVEAYLNHNGEEYDLLATISVGLAPLARSGALGLYVLAGDGKVNSNVDGEVRRKVQRVYRMAMVCNPSGVGTASTRRVLVRAKAKTTMTPRERLTILLALKDRKWLEKRPVCKLYMED